MDGARVERARGEKGTGREGKEGGKGKTNEIQGRFVEGNGLEEWNGLEMVTEWKKGEQRKGEMEFTAGEFASFALGR